MSTIRGDTRRKAVVHSAEMEWSASPSGTVWRRRLHLVGGSESGQVTSIVRFGAGATFHAHEHPEGEEILVLEGVFSDERGDWPAGSYLLNPEGFRHSPFSAEGCLLFVKLRQYGGEGRASVALQIDEVSPEPGEVDGVERRWLYRDERFADSTRVERWSSGTELAATAFEGGAEVFVLEGSFDEGGERFGAGSWLRLPGGGSWAPRSRQGCRLYIKAGGVSGLRSDS